MIGNLKYIAIAVPDLNAAIHQYQNVFGVFVSSPQSFSDFGLQLAVVKLPNILLELITPLGENSPLLDFLKQNPQGGVHHLCYEVSDIAKAKDQLVSLGARAKEEGASRLNYRGNPVLYLEAQDCPGVLIELEQSSYSNAFGRVEIERIGPAHSSPSTSSNTLKGVGGIGIGIKVDFKRPTPEDNREGE